MRQHLEQVEKQTGKKPKELAEIPEIPPEWRYLWGYFLELNNTDELTYSEIESWARLTKREVSAFEVDVILSLNRIRKKVIYERNSNTSDSSRKHGQQAGKARA